MLNNLRALYIFSKAVEIGSFRATAKALDLSPSVVSYQISNLEKELEIALLYRSTRKLALTSEGEELFHEIAPLFAGAEKTLDKLTSSYSEPIGHLNVTIAASFSRENITREIARFAQAHPKVELNITYTDQTQDLIKGSYDLAIRSGRIRDSSLKAKKLFTIQRKLVAAPGYTEKKPSPASPKDLSDWDWIWLGSTPDYRVFTHRKNQTKQKVKLKKKITVNDGYAMCEFATEGVGVLTSPVYLVEERLKAGSLVEILPDWRVDSIDIFAIWPSNAPRTGLTQQFVNFLTEI